MIRYTKVLKQQLAPSGTLIFDPTSNFGNYRIFTDNLGGKINAKITYKPTGVDLINKNIDKDLADFFALAVFNEMFKVTLTNTDTVNQWVGLMIIKNDEDKYVVPKFEDITVNAGATEIRELSPIYRYGKVIVDTNSNIAIRFRAKDNANDFYKVISNSSDMLDIARIFYDHNIKVEFTNNDNVNPQTIKALFMQYRGI